MKPLAKFHGVSLEGDGYSLQAEVVVPIPNGAKNGCSVLFVHGWDSDHRHYEDLSERVGALGYTCLTFDLRGHGRDRANRGQVNRDDNLRDVLIAYDALAKWRGVDPLAITMVGTSYGGYLAALATALRPVRALGLRVPALYPDEHWDRPKQSLDRGELHRYRSIVHRPEGNRALEACKAFRGDVLVVPSGGDELLPPASVESFTSAFVAPRSKVVRSIPSADHALTDPTWQKKYAFELLEWLKARRIQNRRDQSESCRLTR